MKKRMKKSNISTLFLLSTILHLISLFHCVHCTLEENCKKMVGPNLPYDFCVKTLSANPASKTADILGLGVISSKLTLEKATLLKTKVENLLNDPKTDKRLKSALKDCLEAYDTAVDKVKEAATSLQARRYSDANVALSAVFDSSVNCETSMSELNVASPFPEDNKNFKQMTAIPLTISNLAKKMGV